jgi:ubiquinone/menaquinone biosynthesis C-methylase UbiE
MIRMYDRALISANYRRYFEDSGFYNFGYWEGGAKSQREASEALVDELIGRIANKGERILDVACGPGASTRRLLRYYAPDKVTGINISENQIAAARERAPGCAFLLMDAAQLAFPDNQFDAVMCVEAAFHFNTRARFLGEALRVLKPGGSLVLTDMLFRKFLKPIGDFGQVPPANFVQNIEEYRTTLQAAGFESVEVEDATDRCLSGFRRHLARWPAGERRRGRMSLGQSLMMSAVSAGIARYFRITCKAYLMASARKPYAATCAQSTTTAEPPR